VSVGGDRSGSTENEHDEATGRRDVSERPETGTPPGRTLAEKLDRLFRTMHPRDRGEYSLEEVAEGIRKRGGPTISATYIWQLRKGLKDNPTKKHLEALADFFGVSPLYFFDDEAAQRIEEQLVLLVALRDAPIRHLALRAVGLSPQSLQTIASIVEHVRRLEGLPNGPNGPKGSPGPEAAEHQDQSPRQPDKQA
jgi:transcriptional regulator with XRE-family HTH domain